jgi:hypothetical protein
LGRSSIVAGPPPVVRWLLLLWWWWWCVDAPYFPDWREVAVDEKQ